MNKIKNLLRLCICLLICVNGLCHTAFASQNTQPPNILFILSDDAGYGDFGFQGSQTFKTPRLDALAAQSVFFKQAYTTAAVCGPSRAGLYTGRYQQRFGFEENNVPGYMSTSGLMGEEMGLPLDEVTVADYLKALGYHTALFGKWHQGDADKYHPTFRGFDTFFGFRGGSRSYYEINEVHARTHPQNRLERGFGNFETAHKNLTDVLADEAISYIQQTRRAPFFAVLSLTAVHTPMEADEADIQAFPELTGRRQQLAAMTLSMDRAIGRVLDALDKSGLSENTLVVFTNDNGGPSDTNASNNYPLSGTKANHLEGGIRVPMLMRWPTKFAANSTYSHPVSFLDFLPTFVAAAGGELPTDNKLDGVNLLPFLNGTSDSKPHNVLYWKKENRAAIRVDEWKLLRYPDRPAELYNIAIDPSETNNLAFEQPDKVRQMFKQLFEWELTLERPKWQLLRKYEGAAMERMDTFRTHSRD